MQMSGGVQHDHHGEQALACTKFENILYTQ